MTQRVKPPFERIAEWEGIIIQEIPYEQLNHWIACVADPACCPEFPGDERIVFQETDEGH